MENTSERARFIEVACNHYEIVKKAQAAYYERKRQVLRDAGTYRGPGRPRKLTQAQVQVQPPLKE